MKLVIIESPFAGTSKNKIVKYFQERRNKRYARRCLKHSLDQGEAPIASHLLYTQVLDDNIPEERQQGIDAGLAWRKVAEGTVVYIDYGITRGMQYGIDLVEKENGNYLSYRRIGKN